MHTYLAAASCLFAVYIAYYFLSIALASRRHAQDAARLGCKPPLRRDHTLPLGIDLVQKVVKADREKHVPDMFLQIYEELGCPSTWTQNFLGADDLITADPKNIQAMLSTQFNDFEIGRERRENFAPLLGNGIFTADGKAW